VYEYNPFKTFRINTTEDSELVDELGNPLPKGSILDLDTSKLKFDLKHPVDMTI
jgi:hypothetical protein